MTSQTYRIVLFCLCLTPLFLAGCPNIKKVESVRMDNVVLVEKKVNGPYTITANNPTTKELTIKTTWGHPIRIFTDVSNDEPMWATYDVVDIPITGTGDTNIEIHIHSLNDIKKHEPVNCDCDD